MLRSIIDVNLCKFLSPGRAAVRGHHQRFVPGGGRCPKADYGLMQTAMREACAEMNLQPDDYFFLKTIQLYEMIVVRHGLMIVGQPFSGRRATYRVSRALWPDHGGARRGGPGTGAMGHRDEPQVHHDGTAVRSERPQTHEWQDGVLAVQYRNAAQSRR